MRDALADSQDKQKEKADSKGRSCIKRYEFGDQVLLTAKNLPTNQVSAVLKTKMRPRFIVSFKTIAKKGFPYTLKLSRKLRTHPVFYVGLLNPYQDSSHVNLTAIAPRKLVLPSAVESE